MPPEPNFTMRELLEQIAELDQSVELGEKMRTKDFQEVLGVGSEKTARTRIRPFVQGGVLIPTTTKIKNMAGRTSTVPAYAINPNLSQDEILLILEELKEV